jgi:hypothetical protein
VADADLELAWLDFDGHRSGNKHEVAPKAGEAVEIVGTYVGHAWAVYIPRGTGVARSPLDRSPRRRRLRGLPFVRCSTVASRSKVSL